MAGYSEEDMNKFKPVIYWLILGCVLIFSMVVVGGLTRLTGSGLSMTDYRLVTGSVPPLNDADWLLEFEKYKNSPQFQKVNFSFSIEDFKKIYWWEFIHRFLGRMIGLVFIIPFVFFLIKKMIPVKIIPKLIAILFLGGFQGFLGWYMVKSGLVDRPAVSHFRLAAHLITAFMTFALTYWTAMDLMVSKTSKPVGLLKTLNNISIFSFIVLAIQIIYGAFVAGLKAGYVYNTWPKMGDEWIASSVKFGLENKGIGSFVNEIAGIQFVHRYVAYVVVVASAYLWIKARSPEIWKHLSGNQKSAFNGIIIIVLIQFFLGIFTLIYKVPLSLGVLHQLGAMFLFTNFLWLMHTLRREELAST